MVYAYPIDKHGNKEGRSQRFSDRKWDKMVLSFGKKLRFKKTSENKPDVAVSVELLSDKDKSGSVSTKEAKFKPNPKSKSKY